MTILNMEPIDPAYPIPTTLPCLAKFIRCETEPITCFEVNLHPDTTETDVEVTMVDFITRDIFTGTMRLTGADAQCLRRWAGGYLNHPHTPDSGITFGRCRGALRFGGTGPDYLLQLLEEVKLWERRNRLADLKRR